jgi:hypothetical protein
MSRLSKKAQAKSSKSGRAQVNVRTTPELLARIDEARIDTSRSEFIVQAIEAYLGIEPASPQTTATVQSLVDAAVAQAIQGVTRTLEERLKVLESRLSALDVDFAVDAAIDEVSLGVVDERVDSGDAPVEEVGSVSVDQPVDALVDSGDAPVDSVDDAPDDAVEGEELATSGEPGLEEATGGDRHVSQESEVGVDAPVDSVDDAADDAVEGEELATSGGSGLEEATGGDRHASQESEVGVDAPFDFTTQGLSGKELASRLSVSPSSVTSNRQKKGTNAFAKWTSQQDPDGLAWNHKKGRYYPDEPKG